MRRFGRSLWQHLRPVPSGAGSVLLTLRPWRSLAYLLSAPVVASAWAGLMIGAAVLLVGLANQVAGVYAAIGIAAGELAVALPLASIVLSAVERRLRLVDPAPAPSRHRPVGRIPLRRWLTIRCWERATWWEVGYALLFCVALAWFDLLAGALLLTLPLATFAGPLYDLVVPSSPLHRLGRDNFAGPLVITSVPQAIAVGAAGLLLFVPAAYAAVGLGWARGMVTRLLLSGPRDEELTDRLRSVSRSRSRMAGAFDAERRRIERDLHDGVQQRLTALIVTLGVADIELAERPEAARALVRRARGEAQDTLAELRRLVQGIHPPVLTSRGLAAALEDLAERSTVRVDLDVRLPDRLAQPVESAAYFVVAEALGNVTKHSRATRAWVNAHADGALLCVEIGDDGVGAADPDRGTGLLGLGDRVGALDGRIALSSPSGGPTILRIELPCRQP